MLWRSSSVTLSLEEPLYLGILNVTPDSFSDGGHHETEATCLAQAHYLAQGGVRVFDVGAESTRPGAKPITEPEEWARLQKPLRALRTHFPTIPVSLDTRHANVAQQGLASEIAILNDVCGFEDAAMLALAQHSDCLLLAMRSRRQSNALVMPPYENPEPANLAHLLAEMAHLKNHLLTAGLTPERILLDPGFGFGTTFLEDLALWEALPQLPHLLDWPVERFCIGISRKRFLAWRAGQAGLPPLARDGLTRAAHLEAEKWGYRVFRSHQPPSWKNGAIRLHY